MSSFFPGESHPGLVVCLLGLRFSVGEAVLKSLNHLRKSPIHQLSTDANALPKCFQPPIGVLSKKVKKRSLAASSGFARVAIPFGDPLAFFRGFRQRDLKEPLWVR
ncbi:MAG: hypothetical protein HYY24_27765 [Verrucomicrobia bacterium]|nr:hypothetical protein [Verrucomicrobiota bacterium]